MGDMGDYWNDVKECRKEEKERYKLNYMKRDIEFLKNLMMQDRLAYTVEDDGSGGDKYKIMIHGDRGLKTVYWWASTGFWKVVGGRAEGYGIYRMARYFQLIPKREGGKNE